MRQLLGEIQLYEWQIGIGLLLILGGAAAGLRTLRRLRRVVAPDLHILLRIVLYSFWAVILGTVFMWWAVIQNPITTL